MPPPARMRGRWAPASRAAAWATGLGVAGGAVGHGPVGARGLYVPVDGLAVDQVAGNVQQHGALLAVHGGAEGVVEHLGDAVGLVDLQGKLGDGLEGVDQVELLGAVAVGVLLRGVARDGDDRRAALVGQGDAGGQVDGARAGGGDAGGGLARGPGVAVGHEGGALLVAGVDEGNVVPPVKLGNDAVGGGAHQSKDMVHALGLQSLNDGASGCHLCHGGCSF